MKSTSKATTAILCFASMSMTVVCGQWTVTDLGNQTLASHGMVDASAAPFNADPSGIMDASDAINNALVFSRDHNLVTYLPAGDYRISKTIHIAGKGGNVSMNSFFTVLQGARGESNGRTRLILAPNSPGFGVRNPVPIVVHAYNPDSKASSGYNYTSHFNQMVRNIDIIIGEGNSAAVGIRMQGAEGCIVEDVYIDARHGWKGAWGLPGSGGSTHGLTVLGGEIGVELRGYLDNGQLAGSGTQPGPMISQLRLLDQTDIPLVTRTRGSLTLVGFEIRSTVATKALRLERLGSENPWGGSLSLVDGVVELNPENVNELVDQQQWSSTGHGRGYTAHNVFIKGISQLDTASGLAADPQEWTRIRELAVVSPLVPHQGNDLKELIMKDGVVMDDLSVYDAQVGLAPDRDYVRHHGYGQQLPGFEPGDVLNLLDFGADPAGTLDSTEALRSAIAAGRDIFIPMGDFKISDTVYLKSTTRLFGIHPRYSIIKAADPASGRRFAAASPGDPVAPMIVSPNDRQARTVISLLGIEAPRAAANHSRIPVLVYPLKWQSGRNSIIHSCEFSPYNAYNWRLQFVMQSDFRLTQETSPYLNGGLEFSGNDILDRLIIETFSNSARLMTPFVKDGVQVSFVAEDGGSFDLQRLDLSKATWDAGVSYSVTVRGIRSGAVVHEQTAAFAVDWMDRAALRTLQLNWSNLDRVEITAMQPFGVDNVTTSKGTATMEKPRPFFVVVDCGDARRGFEHYPFATIRHPQVLITGFGGGRWYNSFHHGDIWAQPDFRFIEVRDTVEPLYIYHWHLQHVHSDTQAVFRNARNVDVYGIKSEHNSQFLAVYDSDHIRVFGFGGLADAEVGRAHFYFENTPNFLHAACAEEPHFFDDVQVWSICDNPLIVHNVSLFDGIQEKFGNENFRTPALARTILYKRGQPQAVTLVDSYDQWAELNGLSGAEAAEGADPRGSGFANLLRYALGMDEEISPSHAAPLKMQAEAGGVVLRYRLPVHRQDIEVKLIRSDNFNTSAFLQEWTLASGGSNDGFGRLVLSVDDLREPRFFQIRVQKNTSR